MPANARRQDSGCARLGLNNWNFDDAAKHPQRKRSGRTSDRDTVKIFDTTLEEVATLEKCDALTEKAAIERSFVSRRPLDRLEIFVCRGYLDLSFKIVVEASPAKLDMTIVEASAENILMQP